MVTSYAPTAEEIKTAHFSSFRRFGYPQVKEKITIFLDVHPNWRKSDGTLDSFVRMSAIPERLHEAVKQLSRGSCAPAPDDNRDSLFTHDVERWLLSIGVEVEFIEPTQAENL